MTSLKEKIVRGDIVLGVSVPIDATKSQMEDILGKDDYDFINADAQHSPYNEDKLVQYCATAKEVGIPVQFRIKHPRHAYLVGNILDLGPLGYRSAPGRGRSRGGRGHQLVLLPTGGQAQLGWSRPLRYRGP